MTYINIQTSEDFTQAFGVYDDYCTAIASLLLEASKQYDQNHRFDPISDAEGETGMVFNVYNEDGKCVDSFFTLTLKR